MSLKFNNVIITNDTILKTRKYYIDLANKCINAALNGSMFVNDIQEYIAQQKSYILGFQSDKYDYSISFLQRAYYIQTGECIALLP